MRHRMAYWHRNIRPIIEVESKWYRNDSLVDYVGIKELILVQVRIILKM